MGTIKQLFSGAGDRKRCPHCSLTSRRMDRARSWRRRKEDTWEQEVVCWWTWICVRLSIIFLIQKNNAYAQFISQITFKYGCDRLLYKRIGKKFTFFTFTTLQYNYLASSIISNETDWFWCKKIRILNRCKDLNRCYY